jgi:hypothetical protein
MPDPVNTYVRPASGVYKSQVDVPGITAEWMAFREVPHGALHEHWYLHKKNATARRVVVYTPPGYGAGTQRYPGANRLRPASLEIVCSMPQVNSMPARVVAQVVPRLTSAAAFVSAIRSTA